MAELSPRHLAVDILDRVFKTGSYADILLASTLRTVLLSPEDRALTTDLVYGTLRWWGWLTWILQKTYHGEWRRIPPVVKRVLEMGLYQLLFLDKIPDHAAVNESVKIAVEKHKVVWGRVVNAMLREILRNPSLTEPPDMATDPVHAIAVRWSHPDWMVQRWVDLWGVERTKALCQANNERPLIGVRINPIKSIRDEILKTCQGMFVGAAPSKFLDTFITVEKSGSLVTSDDLKNGLFTIQDESAGLVGLLVDPQPGERIIDLASAPGGKAAHMAEIRRDTDIILAVDRHSGRLGKVVENIRRLNLKSIFPVLADGCRSGLRPADKVLVDAPCSSLGGIRKQGELRWRRKPEDIPHRVALQKELLNAASDLVKPGGVLVYSTCTIMPEENQNQIDAFLETHLDFGVDHAGAFVDERVVSSRGFIETWPDRHNMDGSFAARLKRKSH